jgi:protease I
MILRGKTVGVFVAEGFEDLEFWVPVMRLREEGARTLIIGIAHGTVIAKHCSYARCSCFRDQLGRAGRPGDTRWLGAG